MPEVSYRLEIRSTAGKVYAALSELIGVAVVAAQANRSSLIKRV
jgi:hypothetical protein